MQDAGLQEECRKLAEQKRKELDQKEAERVAGIRRIVAEKRRERMEAAKQKKKKTAKKG